MSRIANEYEIERYLTENGVDVVDSSGFRTFAEQVRIDFEPPSDHGFGRLFSTNDQFLFPTHHRIAQLDPTELQLQNYRLAQRLRCSLLPPKQEREVESHGEFLRSLWIENAPRVAEELLAKALSI